jgi:dynein heavy chain
VEFNNVIDALMKSFVTTVEKFKLASPTVSYLFAGDRFDENPFADGPRIGGIVQDDLHFIYSHLYIKGALRGNFKHATEFLLSLESFRQMHIENSSADFASLRNPNINLDQMDKVLDFFESGLAKYSQQKSNVSGMSPTTKINNLLVDVQKLKQTLIPSPTRCFQLLSEILPILSRQRNESLLNRLNRSVKILTYVPQSIENYVEFLDHLAESNY